MRLTGHWRGWRPSLKRCHKERQPLSHRRSPAGVPADWGDMALAAPLGVDVAGHRMVLAYRYLRL